MLQTTEEAGSRRALVLLAPGAEEMEVVIIVDVLRRGGVEVVLAGIQGAGPVGCSRAVTLVPDVALSSCVRTDEAWDLLVLPGGAPGTDALAASEVVGEVLRQQCAAGRLVGAICAAPLALARHGVFAGVPMTSHPSVSQEVASHGVWTSGRVVEADGLITSMGPGTAFAFALTLVAKLRGAAVAEALRAPMILD